MLIDSHCHLHDREFFSEKQAEEMLINAKKAGIEQIICIGTDPQDSLKARDFARKHEGVFWTYGTHPSEISNESEKFVIETVSEPAGARPLGRVSKAKKEASAAREDGPAERRVSITNFSDSSLVAIGEIGLDYHFEPFGREAQIKLFEQMLQLALDHNLPVSFHIREAFQDFFPIIQNFPKITGVVHSFSDNQKNLKKILETTDFYIGVNGLATYNTLPTPPLDRILLETDAPFLTPVPNRGKINEPAYIKNISEFISTKTGVPETKVAEITTQNARQLFHLPSTFLR